jgi:pilus assembly protein FimV
VCKSIFKLGLFLIMLMSPWAVHAAGLGKLTVNSALGQPFKAEIDLVAVKKEEIPSLEARLASRDAFRKADVDYAPFLSTFTVSVEARSDGQPYIRIISSQPVVEPFLSMLIELNWASGRLLREYTVLLDLPETDKPQPVAPVIQAAPVIQNVPAVQITPTEPPVVETEPVMVEKPDAPIKDFISDKKPAIPEPVPVGRTGGTTYGPIRSGDTLSRIARQVAPDGVNLNQMLVALHRANRDAFSGNNINRLKAGPILRVPDSDEIAKISSAEAAIEVKAQIADWNAYRQKLATATGATPATGAPKQTASGKITTIVEDNSAAAREPSKEVLKLSKGEELSGASGKGVNASQDRIRAMEEDAIARNKALTEANERVALLEKNIKEMQHLLELKSATMVEAQKRAEGLKPDVATPSSVPTASPKPAPVPAMSAESEDVSAAPAESDAPAVTVVEPAKPAVDSAVTPVVPSSVPVESSLMDDLMQNIEYVGGVLALLLAGILGASMMRRKKEIPVAGSDVIAPPPITETQLHDEALPVVAAPAPAAVVPETVISTGDVDPIAEAEIYLDYGRDTQAEKTLTEALVKDPNRPEILAKLLEVYVQRKDKVAFEATARTLKAVAPSSPLWERAAGLGAGIDPGNPLYGDAVATNTNATKDQVAAPISDSPQNVTEAEMISAMDFDMDDTTSTPANQSAAWKQTAEPDSGMGFDAEYGSDDHKASVIDTQSTAAAASTMPAEEGLEKAMAADLDAPATHAAVETPPAEDTGLAFSIDFPVTPEPESEPAAVSALDFAPLPESDLVDIDLNLGEPLPNLSADTKPTESAHWHEIATKIDLARAYQEMGDNDGAREILEEVMREGDAQQQESAQTMLASL